MHTAPGIKFVSFNLSNNCGIIYSNQWKWGSSPASVVVRKNIKKSTQTLACFPFSEQTCQPTESIIGKRTIPQKTKCFLYFILKNMNTKNQLPNCLLENHTLKSK